MEPYNGMAVRGLAPGYTMSLPPMRTRRTARPSGQPCPDGADSTPAARATPTHAITEVAR